MIIFKEGQIHEYVYFVDVQQYGMARICSAFIYWDRENAYIMDVGTSDSVPIVLRYLKKHQIPQSRVKGILMSHWHFDHGGGCLNLWRRIVEKNPSVKIYVPQDNHDKLQNSKVHMTAAATTFGDFVGTMNPVPEEAYEIVKKDVDLPLSLTNGYSIQLLATPGHIPSHVSPTIFKNGKAIFCFTGEAFGTLFHSKKLVSLPTSMPSNFQYDQYLKSVKKIEDLNCDLLGFCHFGVLQGQQDILEYITEHKSYMEQWRTTIQELFKINQSTKYIMDHTDQFWLGRFDFGDHTVKIFQNLKLALTYGCMIDLGLRTAKYEPREV